MKCDEAPQQIHPMGSTNLSEASRSEDRSEPGEADAMPWIDLARPASDKPWKRTSLTHSIEHAMPALGPSALATGCFPCLILTTGLSCAVAYALITSISHNSSIDLTEMIFVLFFSIITSMVLLPIGSGYGLVMGAFAVSLAGLFHWSCYARIPRRVLMQLVGGATGYWSVIFLIELSSDKRDVMLIPGRFAFGWTVALFSMLWGMLFNAVQHRRKTARMRRLQTIKLSPPVDSPTPPIQWQFGVRDTMIIVTWVAALSAILRCASISLLLAFLIWLIAQPIALVTGVFLARTLARRGAVHNVIRPQHRL